MSKQDWTDEENRLLIDDYLSMLKLELAGSKYVKADHWRALIPLLNSRTKQSIEYKYANVSAALLATGLQYINGYKPRSNYQAILDELLLERLAAVPEIFELAASDADRPGVVPEVKDILEIVADPPKANFQLRETPITYSSRNRPATDYLLREAQNRSLGNAGELFAIRYERERLTRANRTDLAKRVEHASRTQGDQAGFDIASYEVDGSDRLIEVKTTKSGIDAPFFVTANEVAVSEHFTNKYHVYRLFEFQNAPQLYLLRGAISKTCNLSASSYRALPK